jgi:dolichol-phosphate mannosyltransferase
MRFNTDLTDSQNGFRAIRKDVASKLGLKEDIFTIDQEMVIRALKRNYKVVEIASHEYERKYGKSRINLLAMGWRYIWSLAKNII